MRTLKLSQSLFFVALMLAGNLSIANATSDLPQTLSPIATKEIKTTEAKKDDSKNYSSDLDATAFAAAHLGLQFDGPNLQMTGLSQPSSCVEGLTMKDIIDRAPSDEAAGAATSSDTDAPASTKIDLETQTSHVGVRITYKGPYKSYSDCYAAHQSDEDSIDLSGMNALSKSVLKDKEVALAGLLDANNKILLGKDPAVSPGYKKLKELVARTQCTQCNKNPKTVAKLMSDLKDQSLPFSDDLKQGLIADSLAQEKLRLESPKSLADLKRIRENLYQYAEWIKSLDADKSDRKSELQADVSADFVALLAKTKTLAAEKGGNPVPFRDFMKDTFATIAKLPGADDETKTAALAEVKAYSKGGAEGIEFISSIDPANAEVMADRNQGLSDIAKLTTTVTNCHNFPQQRNFAQCGVAEQSLLATQQHVGLLQQNFQQAQSKFTQEQQMNQLLARGPMMFSSGFNNASGNRPQTVGLSNNTFGLNPTVFGTQASNQVAGNSGYASGSLNNLYNQNTLSYQPSNNPMWKVNSNETLVQPTAVSIPLDPNFLQSNLPAGQGSNFPIKTGFTPTFQS